MTKPPVREKLHLILLCKKSAQNKFILKQRSSKCLTGSKVWKTQINYAEIRKQMPGAWPAPYFFKVTLYILFYILRFCSFFLEGPIALRMCEY